MREILRLALIFIVLYLFWEWLNGQGSSTSPTACSTCGRVGDGCCHCSSNAPAGTSVGYGNGPSGATGGTYGGGPSGNIPTNTFGSGTNVGGTAPAAVTPPAGPPLALEYSPYGTQAAVTNPTGSGFVYAS